MLRNKNDLMLLNYYEDSTREFNVFYIYTHILKINYTEIYMYVKKIHTQPEVWTAKIT